MSNLADTFPYTGPVTSPSFPATVSSTPPANPTIGMIWFNPTGNVTQVYTSGGWRPAGGGGGGTATTLSALLDVDTSGMVDGDTLIYDNSTSKWMAVPPDHDAGRY